MSSTHLVTIFGAVSKWLINTEKPGSGKASWLEASLQIHINIAAALHKCSQAAFLSQSLSLILYWNPDILPILSKKEKRLAFLICIQETGVSHCWSLILFQLLMLSRCWCLLESTQYPQQPGGLLIWRSVLLFLFPCVFHSLLRMVLCSFVSGNIDSLFCAGCSFPLLSSLNTLESDW